MIARPRLDLASLLAPESIAVIGASADEGRHNGRPIANLERTGYTGRVYPITPREGDVRGYPSFRTIGDVPERVDLAYVLVRADLVEQIVTECAAAGVRNLVVNSSGFAEEGADGRAAQERIRDTAWRAGMRVIGPNCIGLLSVPENVVSVTTLNITIEHTPGDVSIVSQSGGMGTNIFNRAQGAGVGVRAMLSLGNEADVDVADAVDAFADDPLTSTILLYVEQLRDTARFHAAVGRARAAGKLVVCAKAGRTDAGSRSAQSHTGAMAGSYRVFRDRVAGMGVTIAESLDELVDVAKMRQRIGDLDGSRVLVVSPSGGECGYVSDLAEEAGLAMPEISAGLSARLRDVMRFGAPSNPLDLTGQIIGDNELLGRVFEAISASHEYDVVIVALPTWGPFDSKRLMPAILEAAAKSAVPMIVTAWASHGLTEWRDELLRQQTFATFDDADRAVDALAALAGSASAELHRAPESAAVAWDPLAARDEAAAKRWLARNGIAVSREIVIDDGNANAWTDGFPVVVKGVAPGVAHKSELGLVKVGVRDEGELDGAIAEVSASAGQNGVALHGHLVARQYVGVELIVGVVDDESFGKTLMIGAGGVLAELLDDAAFVACPATPVEIEHALGRLRIHRLLAGFRGAEADVPALIDLLVRVSEIAAGCDELSELDLNPVIVGAPGEGAIVVDALARARGM